MKKYELTKITKNVDGHELFRIKALKDIGREVRQGPAQDGDRGGGDKTMNDRQREAYEWAKRQSFPSVAARYAKELAGLVDELVEVAKEDLRIHGRWEWFEEQHGTPIDGYDYDWGWRCSCCKMPLGDVYDSPDWKPEIKYCPNCGAKMNGGMEECSKEGTRK